MSNFGNVFVKNSNFGSANSQLVSNINAVKLRANMITGEAMVLNQGIDVDNATIRGGVKIEGETEVNKRIYQELNSDSSFNDINGYYGLAKDAQPSVSQETAEKALSGWTDRTGAIRRFESITWSSKYGFVAVGLDNSTPTIIKIPVASIDGLTWTDISFNLSTRLRFVIWSSELNMFVAVGTDGLNRTLYSIGGNDNWVEGNSGVELTNCNNDGSFNIICDSTENLYIGKQINILDGSGNVPGNTTIVDIINETTFTTNNQITDLSNTTLKANSDWFQVIWVKELGLFIAYGAGGAIMTSSDGINWINRFGGLSNWIIVSRRLLSWSPELKLLIATDIDSGRFLFSNNGIDWQVINNPDLVSKNLIEITWSSSLGIFVLVPYALGNFIYISYDGFNWEQIILPISTQKTGCNWIKELNIFLITSETNDNFFISNNGINWKRIQGIDSGNIGPFVYSPELGLGVFGTYHSNNRQRIFTTQLKGRIPTSYNVFDNSFNNIDNNGNWTIQQVLKAGTYTLGVTNPSVRGTNLLVISNDTSTTITNFTNGTNNQVLTLVFNDSNTIIQRSTNIRLAGGVNFTPTQFATLQLIFITGSGWLELSRSVNS